MSQLTADDEARIAADALVIACRDVWRDCSAKTFYATLQGPVTAPAVQAAIIARFPGVTFVAPEALEALLGDDRLIDGGRGALLSVRDVRTLATDVVGVVVGVDHWMGVEQFRWTGAGWVPAEPSETGITVTTAVS